MYKTDKVGYAMESLTDHMSNDEKELVVKYESILCTIFGKHYSWGSDKCYALRKTIVDLVDATQEADYV